MKVNAPEVVNPLGSAQRFRIALCVVGLNLCFSLVLAYEEGGEGLSRKYRFLNFISNTNFSVQNIR